MPGRQKTQPSNFSRSEWMLRRLATAGLRMTEPRTAVVRAIASRPGAFTAESLAEELRPRGVGRATVFRAVEVLQRLGLLTRMHLDHWHGYTVCDEGHHHHLVCGQCGKVISVDAAGIEAEIKELAERLKFRVDTHTLEFAGVCEPCQERGAVPEREAPGAR